MTGSEIAGAAVLPAVPTGAAVPADPPLVAPVFILTAILLLRDISRMSKFGKEQINRVALGTNQ